MDQIQITDCQMPERDPSGHKGTFGRVLLVAGSLGMSGAASLSGKAALRGGAGLVTVMVPSEIQSVVAAYEPGYMTLGYHNSPVSLEDALLGNDGDAVHLLKSEWEGKAVLAVGPGLGQGPVATDLVKAVLSGAPCPVVLDADALNLCAVGGLLQPGLLEPEKTGARIITPHPGEFSRLSGRSISEIQVDRESAAAEYARQNGLVVVLKGPGTVVTDGDRIYVNDTGNSGMATGGSGDVLTGLLAALVALGLPAFDASCVATWLHGAAGDSAAEAFSQEALIASDLPQHFGRAFRQLKSLIA